MGGHGLPKHYALNSLTLIRANYHLHKPDTLTIMSHLFRQYKITIHKI